jgi:hypothetical protein
MSVYKAYPKENATPQRMARKRMRRDVFLFNKKASKLRRKTIRLERKLLGVSYE